MDSTTGIFQSFMPHGMCYAWRPDILLLHLVSDALVALTYFAIPFALIYLLKHTKDKQIRRVVFMLGAFSIACAFMHSMSIWMIWDGQYGLQGMLKLITALIAVVTVVLIILIAPKLLAFRSPAELREANDALQSEISTREQQEQQNVELQNELVHCVRLNHMGLMATGLAHELNQPLMAISQSADLASIAAVEAEIKDPDINESLQDIQAETMRAGEIIRALRQLVGKESSSRIKVDLKPLVDQVVQLVTPETRTHNIRIDSSAVGDNVVEVDRVQIAQVLLNLIRNGIQSIEGANCSSGEVIVKAECANDQISVSVEDSGPGIADDQPLFTPFSSSKENGMGMGLSICKKIIESHGGSLVGENRDDGGARFCFTLPYSPT